MSHPLRDALNARVPRGLRGLAGRFLELERTLALLRAVEQRPSFSTVVEHLGHPVRADGLEHVPREGPLVVFANHPFPFADLSSLSAVLESHCVGPVKVAVDGTSVAMVEMEPLFIRVTADREAFWREVLEHLGGGGVLVMFPAGRTVYRDRAGAWVEPPWKPGVLKAAARSGGALVPAFIDARPSRGYNWLRRHFPRETVNPLSFREAFRNRGPIGIRFAQPVPLDVTPEALRKRVYALNPQARFVVE